MKGKSDWLVKPGTNIKLKHFETAVTGGLTAETAAARLAGMREEMARLQEVLYAGEQHALLVVLQGMDTAGKDGTISHIFSGTNPQGCDVASFKVPTPLEARHGFLWRCQKEVPARGMIGIFNRSHYEEVLWPRVHGKIDEKTARQHMDDINAWEKTLVHSGTVVRKFFLHISRDEQKKRLQDRLDDADKHWKFSEGDLAERKLWPAYQDAYEDLLQRTSTKHAPWYVIPADHKWYRNVAISEILVKTLRELKLKYPKPTMDVSAIKL